MMVAARGPGIFAWGTELGPEGWDVVVELAFLLAEVGEMGT